MLAVAIAVVLLLVVLNGLFAMTELAVVSSRKSKLQARAERGDRGARAALNLAEDPTHFLSAVQVGITLIGILAGAYGQASIAGELNALLVEAFPAIAPWSGVLTTALVVVTITYLSLIVGELVPKRLALIFPERIAAAKAGPLSRRAGSRITVAGMPTSAAWRWAKKRKSSLVTTMGSSTSPPGASRSSVS